MTQPLEIVPLAPAARAFDTVAPKFDERFGGWLSVAAQRRAVRAELLRAFAPGSRVLEVGGGTGEDALWLSGQNRSVLLTDPSPAMVRIATMKLAGTGAPTPMILPAERLEGAATIRDRAAAPLFDGAFSNFAGLNCLSDLSPVARGLAQLIRPGGRVALVIFGTMPPGEWLVQMILRSPKAAVRRVARGDVPARLGGQHFTVRYHRARYVRDVFAPWFVPVRRVGIGVFVPPSAAEPWISRWPGVVNALERVDRVVSRPLAALGDHVLYHFERRA